MNSGLPTAPDLLTVDSVTAISVNLSWKPGLNGGYPQTFEVLLKTINTDIVLPNQTGDPIPEPALGQIVKHTVTGLKPKTHYQLSVSSNNKYGMVASIAVNATTLGE